MSKFIFGIIIAALLVVGAFYFNIISPTGKFLTAPELIVTKIIDGDTVVIQGGEHVRLLGIDTPERGERCYKEATARLSELIFNKKISLEKDVDDKDQYGRLLRWIFLDGKSISQHMVSEGYAIARFYDDTKYKSEIQAAEQYAIDNKIGCLWSTR